jgi:hypothetical protein
MDEVLAAPASGLPSLLTALLAQLSCAAADPTAKADTRTPIMSRFMFPTPVSLR